MHDIYELYYEAREILDDLEIEIGKIFNLSINKRTKKVAGRSTVNGSGYDIMISKYILDESVDEDVALSIMVHEVLHCHPSRRNHSGAWKYYAGVISKKYPNLNITRTISPEMLGDDVRRNKAKYVIKCADCGKENFYCRSGKVVNLIKNRPDSHGCRCGKCKSKRLELIKG